MDTIDFHKVTKVGSAIKYIKKNKIIFLKEIRANKT